MFSWLLITGYCSCFPSTSTCCLLSLELFFLPQQQVRDVDDSSIVGAVKKSNTRDFSYSCRLNVVEPLIKLDIDTTLFRSYIAQHLSMYSALEHNLLTFKCYCSGTLSRALHNRENNWREDYIHSIALVLFINFCFIYEKRRRFWQQFRLQTCWHLVDKLHRHLTTLSAI